LKRIHLSTMSKTEELFQSIEERQTVLKELSNHLTELESQLSLIFAASPDMILFIRADGEIIKASQAVWKILGHSKEDMVGKYIWDFIHPDDIEKTKDVRKLLAENGMLYFDHKNFFTNRWRKSDGSYAKLAWRFSFYDANANHTIGFATDITSLIIENPFNFGLLHKAIALTQDGIVITDNTQEDNPVIYVNPAFSKNCGYHYTELIGKNCRILQYPDIEQAAKTTLKSAISAGIGCEVLLKNLTKSGEIFYNHLLLSPIVEDGIVTHYIGVSRNLTSLIEEGVYRWCPNAPTGFGAKIRNPLESYIPY